MGKHGPNQHLMELAARTTPQPGGRRREAKQLEIQVSFSCTLHSRTLPRAHFGGKKLASASQGPP